MFQKSLPKNKTAPSLEILCVCSPSKYWIQSEDEFILLLYVSDCDRNCFVWCECDLLRCGGSSCITNEKGLSIYRVALLYFFDRPSFMEKRLFLRSPPLASTSGSGISVTSTSSFFCSDGGRSPASTVTRPACVKYVRLRPVLIEEMMLIASDLSFSLAGDREL